MYVDVVAIAFEQKKGKERMSDVNYGKKTS